MKTLFITTFRGEFAAFSARDYFRAPQKCYPISSGKWTIPNFSTGTVRELQGGEDLLHLLFSSRQRDTNCPAAQIPAANVPKEKMPNEKTPTEKMPTENRPAEKTPMEKSPAESTPELNRPADSHPDAVNSEGIALGMGGKNKPTRSRTINAAQTMILTVRRVITTPPLGDSMDGIRAF